MEKQDVMGTWHFFYDCQVPKVGSDFVNSSSDEFVCFVGFAFSPCEPFLLA